MRTLLISIAAVVLMVGMTACSGDDANEHLQDELARVTAERDALAAQLGSGSERHDRALEIMGGIEAILDDPASVGTEAEVADLLGTYATEAAVMDDDVFGSVNWRDGFYNTLYAGAMDATIDVHRSWICDDGSQGGVLWTWAGTNARGKPFELAGISLNEFGEDGRISYELVTYPYPDDYVDAAVFGQGTGISSAG